MDGRTKGRQLVRWSVGTISLGGLGSFPQIGDGVLQPVGISEERATGYQDVGAGRCRSGNRVRADPAVHLDVDVAATADHELTQLRDLGLHGRDVGLATETRVHRHHEHHVDQIEHVADGVNRCRRVDGDRCGGTHLSDVAKCAVQVRAGLGVHDEELAARLDVSVKQFIRRLDHEMCLERNRDMGPASGDHVRPERQVRHELAIHDVPLDPVDSSLLQRCALLSEAGEVGGEHRGDDRHRPLSRRTGQLLSRSLSLFGHDRILGSHPVPDLWLEPTAIAVGGEAVARDPDGRVVFITGALPGERVLVDLVEEKATFARGLVVEVGAPVAERQTPPCPYVSAGCGGCDWQHIDPDFQTDLKRELVADTLRRMGRVVEPVVSLGPQLASDRSRTTLRCSVIGGRAGFRRRRSHESLAVEDCLVAHPLLAELITDGRFGEATEVVLRTGARTGERLAVVSPNAGGVSLPDDVMVVGSDELRSGRRVWYHEEVAGRRWRISATSFFQSRADGADALAERVVEEVAELAPDARRMIDLYCGVGLFAGVLEARVSERLGCADLVVVAVERHRPAVIDARHNLAGSGARVVRSSLEQWRPSHADVVVADPARSGLGRAGVDAAAATGASLCVLVSCDPASLGRDAAMLATKGFSHVRSTVIDLFPHTSHVEVVSSFARSSLLPPPGSDISA